MDKKIFIYVDESSRTDQIIRLEEKFSRVEFYGEKYNLNKMGELAHKFKVVMPNEKLDELIKVNNKFEYLQMFNQDFGSSNYIIAHSSADLEDITRLLDVEIYNHLELATIGIEENLQLMIGRRARYLNRHFGLGSEYNEHFNINPDILLFNCEYNNLFFNNIVDFYMDLLETGAQNIDRISSTAEIINLYVAAMSIIHKNIDPKFESPFDTTIFEKDRPSFTRLLKRFVKKILRTLKLYK